MSKKNIEQLLNALFRNELQLFSLEDVQKFLLKNKIKISDKDALLYLTSHPMVIELKNNMFITRAGIFTGVPFSFKPTKFEIDNKVIIFGHRFIPFIDPDIIPNMVSLRFLGTTLPKKVITVNTSDIIPLYRLFGEEYVSQYIEMDPANKDLDISQNDYLLPNKVNLTVLDCKSIFSFFNFQLGDRIQLVISDWDKSVLEITPFVRQRDNPFIETTQDRGRAKWFKTAEKALLKVFAKYGACASIDKQLLYLYLENRKDLCVKYSGSIEELLNQSKAIDIVSYGVETRLWRKNEEISVANVWVEDNYTETADSNLIIEELGFSIPWFIVKAYILNEFFNKLNDMDKLLEKLIPEISKIDLSKRNAILLQLQKKRDILLLNYNWFADYKIGQLRSRVLKLYSQLFEMANLLSDLEDNVIKLPQQQIVVFSQLVGHTSQLINLCIETDSISEKDYTAVTSSLEGMEFSFEDIQEILMPEIKKLQKETFSVIKAEDNNGI